MRYQDPNLVLEQEHAVMSAAKISVVSAAKPSALSAAKTSVLSAATKYKPFKRTVEFALTIGLP